MAAKMANDTGKPLTPQQNAVMAKLGPAVLKNKNLDQNLDLLLKTMSAQKPGQTATTNPASMGSTPPPTIK